MVKHGMRVASGALAAIVLVGVARAQIGRLYDPSTVETVSGEVVKVDEGGRGKGIGLGTQVDLKTDKETLEVHLGPRPYLERQGLTIEPKDKLEVKGSRVEVGGKTLLLAAQVKKGDKTVKLRDEKGMPLWRPGAAVVPKKT